MVEFRCDPQFCAALTKACIFCVPFPQTCCFVEVDKKARGFDLPSEYLHCDHHGHMSLNQTDSHCLGDMANILPL